MRVAWLAGRFDGLRSGRPAEGSLMQPLAAIIGEES